MNLRCAHRDVIHLKNLRSFKRHHIYQPPNSPSAHRPPCSNLRAAASGGIAGWTLVLRTNAPRRDIILVFIILEVAMPDILIRDIPSDVIAAIETNARRAGLSQDEYLRKALERERIHEPAGSTTEVTLESLQRFSANFADLADSDVMHSAWS